ncbi:unnamed protein product [Paramecium pentaurelia]|uniref:Uncharacterized protein n=1 Tax=Paramecium pentaurelia TaxID=43138 RepID=A0A8S1YH17_9CILI|nr:unnamed protein product [Paramecium pentaurelia]
MYIKYSQLQYLLQSIIIYSFFSIECKQGYYSDRFSGQFYIFLQSLNCKTFYHSIIQFNDEWKVKLKVINQVLKQQSNPRYFFPQDESNNPQDYKLICYLCNDGFILQNGKCIKQLLRWLIFNLLSLIQQKCSDFLSYFKFCRERTQDEFVTLYSNYLLNEKNLIYSCQCLKAFSFNQDLYYDQIFGELISCQNSIGCENVLNYELNLYCSTEEYYRTLQLISNLDQQTQFKMKNILFDSLLQSKPQQSNFADLEFDSKYEIMNKKFIRKMRIYLISNQEQICSVNQISYISQKFSKLMFNYQQHLKLKSLQKQKFIKNYTFQIFHIQNLKIFNLKYNILLTQNLFLFKDLSQQPYKWKKIDFYLQTRNNNCYSFSRIKIHKVFFHYHFKTSNAQVQIMRFSIFNCIFLNVNLFEFYSNQPISIEFDVIQIFANLNTCSFLITSKITEIMILNIQNLLISGLMQIVITFYNIKQLIENQTINEMKIIDSIIIQFENYAVINNIQINQFHT